ncbi:MaoC/PaaZ C-terminal domain-containing protein [Nitriliruptor alkaliphilus]|uniref:MaoC/PaaZ C-terminal domain-containing protein n=1 Tax=Nitriliruptor alkaliphilus TaxID=427918 RepID=UPI000B1EC3C8|nr:MaoC/PaaZ C-terminal domain-containing protein [Nitriliruptor alkaliphilus]
MTTIEELDQLPSLGRLYARAAVSGALPGSGDDLPDRTLQVGDLAVDRDHLADYARVCGYRFTDALPATYIHVLTFPLQVALMADRRFPFALPGLVHVANRTEQQRPVTADEPLSLTVRTADLRPHRKGRQFDVVSVARVGDELVWSGVSTYLRRGTSGDEAADELELPLDPPPADADGARWRVAADTGRRYAAVSGDRNPIHLTPLTSRMFGFPRPIAHGMWTAARALAAIEDRTPAAGVQALRFGKPLPMPRTVTFAAAARDGGWSFAVRDPRSGAPHLTGTVTPG